MNLTRLLAFVSVMLMLVSVPSSAHQLAPSLMQVQELSDSRYQVSWLEPALSAVGAAQPRPVLPDHCQPIGDRELKATQTATGPALEQIWETDCDGGLFGSEISVKNLSGSGVVLLQMQFKNGVELTRILNAGRPAFTVPRDSGFFGTFIEYFKLGYEHILTGIDHLLFIFGLVLLVNGTWRLVKVITMFTIGHSITLSLAALGYFGFASSLIELLVAISVFFVFIELGRSEAEKGLLGRRPALIAGMFGTLHGLAFAAALSETGLPVRDIPAALLSFNVGVELGQLSYVVAVLILSFFVSKQMSQRFRPWIVYFGGTATAYWCITRTIAVLV